jgi:hypothetical protein
MKFDDGGMMTVDTTETTTLNVNGSTVQAPPVTPQSLNEFLEWTENTGVRWNELKFTYTGPNGAALELQLKRDDIKVSSSASGNGENADHGLHVSAKRWLEVGVVAVPVLKVVAELWQGRKGKK